MPAKKLAASNTDHERSGPRCSIESLDVVDIVKDLS